MKKDGDERQCVQRVEQHKLESKGTIFRITEEWKET